MEERDFLKYIFDDPGSDFPRLVFADWLEERGQAERCELIRVQAALAKESPLVPCDRDPMYLFQFTENPRWAALSRREGELMQRYLLRQDQDFWPEVQIGRRDGIPGISVPTESTSHGQRHHTQETLSQPRRPRHQVQALGEPG